ncbi:MAG: RNA 2',3'-cyclic phosphodiesterase [Firmicutes bacterium]|nr:RNA 2',3'-cyclic phosphodiesterase [Bacillota bacterium]
MRLFIAIKFNRKMKDHLISMQEDLYAQGFRGNMTKPENMHLTLTFIGDFDDPDQVIEIIDGIRFEPFSLKIEGTGAFGDLWWAGLEKNEALSALVKKLRHRLAEAGIPFDRKKFKPHITLIRRAKQVSKPSPRRGAAGKKPPEMTVDHISLMRSDRGKGGMVYTELT